MGAAELINLLSQGSSVVLAAAVVGFITGWIVPGKAHRQLQEELQRVTAKNDLLQTSLLEAVKLAGHVVSGTRAKDHTTGKDD